MLFKTTNIQPYKSMTDDFEWRCSLKKGDEIDYLDTSKTWYLSTVLERNNNTVKIGLRKYRENGKGAYKLEKHREKINEDQ